MNEKIQKFKKKLSINKPKYKEFKEEFIEYLLKYYPKYIKISYKEGIISSYTICDSFFYKLRDRYFNFNEKHAFHSPYETYLIKVLFERVPIDDEKPLCKIIKNDSSDSSNYDYD